LVYRLLAIALLSALRLENVGLRIQRQKGLLFAVSDPALAKLEFIVPRYA
jgi:hypothetical protein